MCQAEETITNIEPESSPGNRNLITENALYTAGCETGELIDLLDTIIDRAGEEWADPAAELRRIANLGRIARSHAAATLSRLLDAEGLAA